MLRRMIAVIAGLVMVMVVAAGCGSSSNVQLAEGKINVVTSFYPLYDFAAKIGGDHVNVINLVPAGVEPHDWSPRSQDLVNLSNAQVFVYQGAGFEGWVNDFLDSLKNNPPTIVEASKGADLMRFDAVEEGHEAHEHEESGEHQEPGAHDEAVEHSEPEAHDEAVEHSEPEAHDEAVEHSEPEAHDEAVEQSGQAEHETEEEGHGHDDGHGHESEFDPHIWLSPVQAKIMAENIKNGLIQADPAHQADYEANYGKLAARLDQLHEQWKSSLAQTNKKEIVVSHAAFGYICREYGLTQMPIMGLSPDAEPTPQDMKEISDFIKEHQVKYIFFEELVSDKLAKTLADDLNIETLVLNPLEGLTEEQVKAGDDYFSIMNYNLQNLLKGLQ